MVCTTSVPWGCPAQARDRRTSPLLANFCLHSKLAFPKLGVPVSRGLLDPDSLVSALPSVPCCVLLRSSPSPWLCVAQRWYQHRGVSCAPLRPAPFHSLCVCFFPPLPLPALFPRACPSSVSLLYSFTGPNRFCFCLSAFCFSLLFLAGRARVPCASLCFSYGFRSRTLTVYSLANSSVGGRTESSMTLCRLAHTPPFDGHVARAHVLT